MFRKNKTGLLPDYSHGGSKISMKCVDIGCTTLIVFYGAGIKMFISCYELKPDEAICMQRHTCNRLRRGTGVDAVFNSDVFVCFQQGPLRMCILVHAMFARRQVTAMFAKCEDKGVF